MFGAVVTYLYEYILGIKQEKDSVGFERITISPAYVDGLAAASGHITTERGVIAVSYEISEGKTTLKVSVPADVIANVATPSGETVEITNVADALFM